MSESIVHDDSEAQAIDQLVATWEEDAPTEELSDDLEVDDNPEVIEDEPKVDEEEVEEEAEGEEQEETPEDDEGTDEEEETEEGEEESEDPQDETQKVTVKVGEEEHEVSVDDLKRLYGQEASLTQKSQEVSEQRKQLEETEQQNEAVMEIVLGSIKEQYEQYANIDWFVAQKQLPDEEFVALREEALRTKQQFEAVTSGVGSYLKQKEERLMADLEAKATEAHKTLNEADIGWSKDKMTELAEFAETFGFSQERIAQTVDAPLFLLLDAAMKANKVATKAKVKKAVKTPKKIITSKSKPKAIDPAKGTQKSLESQLRKSGSEEDAVALLMNQWS